MSSREYLARFPEFADEVEAIDFKGGFTSPLNDEARRTANPQSRFSTGMRISHFELIEREGEGAAGEVWKARDTRLQRIVALKLPRAHVLSEVAVHRFLREGRASGRLRHASIVTVYEAGRDGDTAFIASEYIEGGSLRQRLRRGRLSFNDATELCAKLADALHQAHEQGIVHRDLKPANVIIDLDDQPHVADFGLAKLLSDTSDLTLEGQLLGTIAYMAPEQAGGEVNRVDRRTDVYALGVMFYELLTGLLPFEGEDAVVIHAILHDDPKSPRLVDRSIPRDLETICLKALEKDSGSRYPSAQEMAVDLRRVLRGDPIVARRAGPVKHVWRWIRRHPAAATAMVFAFLALSSIAVAAKMAAANRVLLGLRSVSITTDPPGAELTLVPLSESTGEPEPMEMVHLGPSPVSEELRPGDYLVVAVLPDGRFHEVYRRLPRPDDVLPGVYKHNRWRRLPDGAFEWPTIRIPESTVTAGMAKIEGGESAPPREATQLSHDRHHHVASYYIDRAEFSIADFKRVCEEHLPVDRRGTALRDTEVAIVSCDEAMELAEASGKRLPTESEYEFAAARVNCLDTEGFVGAQSSARFGADDRENEDDRLDTKPPVMGLTSGVAEWTSSYAQTFLEADGGSSTALMNTRLSSGARIVKGGDESVISGETKFVAEHYNPDARVGLSPYWVKPGLGFRCYRSVTPRVSLADFDEEPAKQF